MCEPDLSIIGLLAIPLQCCGYRSYTENSI